MADIIVQEEIFQEEEAMQFVGVDNPRAFKPYKKLAYKQGRKNTYLKSELLEQYKNLKEML